MPDGADDVVPIAGDSVGPEGADSSSAGAARPFVSNNSFDTSGYRALSAAVDELFPFNWMSPPPLPPDFDTEVSPTSDVVPVAGDSLPPGEDDLLSFGADGSYVGASDTAAPAPVPTPPPATTPPVDYSDIDDVIDDVLDRLWAPVDEGLVPPPPSGPRDPWVFIAIVGAVVLIAAAAIGFALTRGSSSHTAEPPTSTTASSTTAPPTTASASVPSKDVTLSLGLGQVSGRTLPLLITLQATPDAPRPLTVKVAMTGPGIPTSDTYQLNPGASVTHTVVGNGCGSWTVQVVSINGQPVHATGNPNLENGATHNC